MAEYIEKNVAIARLTALEIGNPCATMADAKRQIADTRSADVAPVVHARFIKAERPIRYGTSKGYGWECTACKRFTRSQFVDSWEFCPNCGAKMTERSYVDNHN